jgi:hypothetical protein
MFRKNAILVGALLGATLATPVLAAANDPNCLQHNRMVSWRAIDENTLVFIDRQMKEFTVQMKNSCQGVTNGGATLIYDTWTNLSCLNPGMIIHVVAPGLVRSTCSIASVHAGAPDKGPG